MENDENRPNGRAVDTKNLPLRPFFKYQWLDVLDQANKWLEAQILDVDGDSVSIHYKGWKEKYDEILNLSSASEDNNRVRAPLSMYNPTEERYEGFVDLKTGSKIDVHDTAEKWCVGTITDVINEQPNRYQVLVHYEGWDTKYDEWINADSYRLAPLYHRTSPPEAPTLHRSTSNYRPPQDEETKFREELKSEKGWSIRDMAGDGNCLFRSISYQVYGDAKHHGIVREKCMDYVEIESQFFRNYVDGDIKTYITRMRRDGEWGDNVEIQAMSELYSRRVEIYAYSSTPMKTYQRHLGGMNPIRISYHCRCHYNSVEFPQLSSVWLTSEPGVHEDRVIAASRSGGRVRPNTQTQDAELKLALEVSRQEFKRGDNSFDTQIQCAIEESTKISSAGDPLRQALLASAETEMQRAIQASMEESKGSAIQQALAVSMQDSELEKALALSRQQHEAREGGSSSSPPQQDEKKSTAIATKPTGSIPPQDSKVPPKEAEEDKKVGRIGL
eukprot:1353989-Amorphochlora_amoeboformis.AAC.1